MKKENYTSFEAYQDKKFFGFCYPANWRMEEIFEYDEKEEYRYRTFHIGGPRNKANLYTPSLNVTVLWPIEKTVKEHTENLLQKYSAFNNFLEMKRISKKVDGYPAIEVEFSFDMLLPIYSVNVKPTKIHEHKIFIKRGNQFFELNYSSSEEDYNKYVHHFNILVKTFTLLWDSWKLKDYKAPEYP